MPGVQADKKGAKKKKRLAAAPAGGSAVAPAAAPPPAAPAAAAWAGAHPWRPFDRDRDLDAGPRPVSKEELLRKSGKLGDRFGGGADGGRSFL